MATVRMKKGDKYADVFDSPETIKQAQFEGYSLCEEKKTEVEKAEGTEEPSDKKQKTPRQ